MDSLYIWNFNQMKMLALVICLDRVIERAQIQQILVEFLFEIDSVGFVVCQFVCWKVSASPFFHGCYSFCYCCCCCCCCWRQCWAVAACCLHRSVVSLVASFFYQNSVASCCWTFQNLNVSLMMALGWMLRLSWTTPAQRQMDQTQQHHHSSVEEHPCCWWLVSR